jgi:pimeloyl-ACP methyl ester carboxylesterase
MQIVRTRQLRRIGLSALVAGLVLSGVVATQPASGAEEHRSSAPKPTVVIVHGAWADSSGWSRVTADLQAKGYNVLVPPTPLRGLREDSDYLAAFLRDRTTGPVVLVGHSYGGAVITNAAKTDKDVKALVYVNAFVPDEGDSILGLLDPEHVLNPADLFDFVQYPGAPDGDFDLYLKQEVFPTAIANGIPANTARTMAAAQRPVTLGALTATSGASAWKSVPSFYVLGTEDHIVPPALQKSMAEHAGSKITLVKSGHLPMITDAAAVESVIVTADRATSKR